MFDHILLKVKDLKASKRFYTAALAPLGFQVEYEGNGIVCFGPKGAPALCLAEGAPNGPVHIAFVAKTRDAVGFSAAARWRQGQRQPGQGVSPRPPMRRRARCSRIFPRGAIGSKDSSNKSSRR